MRAAAAILITATLLAAGCRRPESLVVGSKPFTESEIVGEMLALLAEADGTPVERRFYIGGTLCFESLRTGAMDAYVEYTGTGLVNILGESAETDPGKVRRRVKDEFARRWGLVWLEPLGFNNTYAIVMRKDHAEKLGVRSISDLARRRGLRCGFDLEFVDRPDGYRGLARRYGALCGQVRQMAPDLMYKALVEEHVDLISGYTTDGRIARLGFVALADDKRFFPPYEAAPLVSSAALRKAPRLRGRLQALAGRITDKRMMRLNEEVSEGRSSAREAARAFLKAEGLLP